MSDKTLKQARGLNSIANPADFRGKGRNKPEPKVKPEPEVIPLKKESHQTPVSANSTVEQQPADVTPLEPKQEKPERNHLAVAEPVPAARPHRAVVPGTKRIRRELSVPIPVADALEATRINPADIVMAAYRKHSDDIYAGNKGRMVSRGRKRLRLSISDKEFDQITRLGEARGWNKSEVVAVLLAAELITESSLDV